jgi:glucokinase
LKVKTYIGLDIGGTKVEGALAQIDFDKRVLKILSKKRFSVDKNSSFEFFMDEIDKLINELINTSVEGISLNDIACIGAGLPGSIDPETSKMLLGNTKFLIQQDFIKNLEAKIPIPVFVQNDANLFVLAESFLGVGKKFEHEFKIDFKKQSVLGITFGTGVGGGFIGHGQVLVGAFGSALEVGHICLDPNGPLCHCGQYGCAELYLSGTALSKYHPAYDSYVLIQKAQDGDQECIDLLENYRKKLIQFLSILNNLFNPHYFVFGGGLSNQAILFKDIAKDLSANIFLSKEYAPAIYINELGDSAGLFGAMIYANEKIKK